MYKMKYIIYMWHGKEVAMIFGSYLQHNELRSYGTIVGAGFVSIYAVPDPTCPSEGEILKVKCFGESVSLHIKSREKQDASVIEEMLK